MAKQTTYFKMINDIKNFVGEPDFELQNVLLYKMDCIKFMEKVNKPIFDLTITSPPYNIGKEYERRIELNQYIEWSKLWIKKVYNLTKENGSFWLNLGYFKVPRAGHAVPISYLLWNLSPFYLLQEIVWHYGAGVPSKKIFSPRNEKFLWYVKNKNNYTFNLDLIRDTAVKYPNQKKNGIPKVNPRGKNPTNVWSIPKVTSGRGRASKERTSHPAQFPLQVIDRIMKACSNSYDMIFDPFLGSGTVAVSALINNRCVVGCEINSEYIKIAKQRIQSVINPV